MFERSTCGNTTGAQCTKRIVSTGAATDHTGPETLVHAKEHPQLGPSRRCVWPSQMPACYATLASRSHCFCSPSCTSTSRTARRSICPSVRCCRGPLIPARPFSTTWLSTDSHTDDACQESSLCSCVCSKGVPRGANNRSPGTLTVSPPGNLASVDRFQTVLHPRLGLGFPPACALVLFALCFCARAGQSRRHFSRWS